MRFGDPWFTLGLECRALKTNPLIKHNLLHLFQLASEFISDKFERQNNSDRDIFVHMTSAKDVLNMNNVFRNVKDILKSNIEKNSQLH